jgi:hypothetical protein
MKHTAPKHHSTARRRERGSTFAELMLATLVVGTTIVASVSSLSGSAKVYHYFSDGPHESLMLAQEVHEAAMMLPWKVHPSNAADFGPDVTTLWDLDELVLNPPRSADYEVILSHIAWSQSAQIRVVDLENPTVEVDPDTFEGDTLTELKVAIYRGHEFLDEFKWWVSEPSRGSMEGE